MKKQILLFCFVSIVQSLLVAQVNDEDVYYHHKANTNFFNRIESTGNSGTGANINVLYQRCKWTINPDDATKTITGDITIIFKTTIANVNFLTLDFNKTSYNNSFLIVNYHGTNCMVSFPTSSNVNVLQIGLPTTISAINTIDSISIQYKGTPPTPTGSLGGYYRRTDNAGNNYIYTLSESYEDKDWWPCKADMQDKIDSLDIEVTVPQSFWVAANGIMIDSSIVSTNRVFKFRHRYPIASYLVSLGIAKYKKWYFNNLTNGSVSFPYVVNIFPDKTTSTETSMMGFLTNHIQVFNALCSKFGNYPFNKEKHGFYEFGFGGGMEHQTFSGIGANAFLGNSVLAHELAHQWWGDKVTMSTWTDLWLAEGFATYSEVIAAELVPSLGINVITKMGNTKTNACNLNNTPIAVSDITNSNTIWSNNNTTAFYQRGAMVVSMLRTLMGDEKFFTACQNYLNHSSYAYANATTTDLQTVFENTYGGSLTNFFGEWIYKKGTPNYTVQWNNNGNNITIQLAQTVSSSGTTGTASSFFPTPVILRVQNTMLGKDTTLIIYHAQPNVVMNGGNGFTTQVNSNKITYNIGFVPTTVSFDTENKIMATGTVSFNAALPNNTFLLEANIKNEALIVNGSSELEAKQLRLEYSINGIDFKQLSTAVITNKTFSWQGITPSQQSFYVRAIAVLADKEIYSNTVLLKQETKTQFTIFPNPTQTSFTINTSNNFDKATLFIKNSFGQVLQIQTISNTSTINITSLPKGYYIAELWQKEKLIGRKSLVKL